MIDTTLDKAKKGSFVTIVNLPAGELKVQMIRLGIGEGDTLVCVERLPGGTIVVQKNRQEIAIGHNLANKIQVIVDQR